jgi:hypothetical protein
MITITARSAGVGRRRPMRAPSCPPSAEPAAISATAPQAMCGAADAERHEHRHDRLERRRRQREQQHRAGDAAERRGGREAQQAAALPARLAPVADCARDRAGHDAEVVRDVRRQRRVPDSEQDGEGDERARADERVDRAAPGGTTSPDSRTRSGSSSLITTRSKRGRSSWRMMAAKNRRRDERAPR